MQDRLDGVRKADVDGAPLDGVRRPRRRFDYRCAACGYGIAVNYLPPSCPTCQETRWEFVAWRPFTSLDDHVA